MLYYIACHVKVTDSDACGFSIQVQMSPLGSGLTVEETVDLFCGEGEQILQWIGYAACSRLAYKRGVAVGGAGSGTRGVSRTRISLEGARRVRVDGE